MYLTKTPPILKQFVKDLHWSIPTDEKELFLTFDDGPIPEVTPIVMDILDQYNAKATFFCVGENAARHPYLIADIQKRGHLIGNHTYSHLEGWKTSSFSYFRDYLRCEKTLGGSKLFRPPYGRISPQQIKVLRHKTNIVMWDVLSGDFDASISSEKCAENVISSAKNGSIIVFHDSLKAKDRVVHCLPKILEHFSDSKFLTLERIKYDK